MKLAELNLDYARYPNGKPPKYVKRFLLYFRLCKNFGGILGKYCRWNYWRIAERHGLEIDWNTQIGNGFFINHAYNITINPKAIIGENCNIHKGVLIGQENRGKREGAPVIGNRVWIGINAAIVGNVTIGDDVLIAPNSYVNCDVPSHSVVFGNPCIIKHRNNATVGYINRTV